MKRLLLRDRAAVVAGRGIERAHEGRTTALSEPGQVNGISGGHLSLHS